MIGYLTLGTNDLDRAAAFYDALLAEIGGRLNWAPGTKDLPGPAWMAFTPAISGIPMATS